jgi:hypothetical protein
MLDDETKKKILEHYQKGQGSIQDLARIYRVSVEQILDLTDNSELKQVTTTGDLVDASEAGPGAQLNYYGKDHPIIYTVD